MFIAHAPAGWWISRLPCFSLHRRNATIAAVVGSLVPDLDMLRFWLWDHGQVHHHRYWTHLPACWLAITVVTLLLLRGRHRVVAAAFFAGVFSHLVLDTVAGDIAWLWPVDPAFFHLITIAPTKGHWILSFVLHPSFLLELAIAASAGIAIVRGAHLRDARPPP